MIYLLLLPMLAAAILIPVIGNKKISSAIISLFACAATFTMSAVLAIFYINKNLYESFVWFSIGGLKFDISLMAGNLNIIMAVMVSFIALMVLLFSLFYMRNEPQERYYCEMSIFIFSMIGIILSGSLLLLYIFWELVGISSYLLIGFYYKRDAAAAAGNKALLMTRIGDISFFSAIVILFVSFHSFSIPYILSNYSIMNPSLLLASVSLLFIAAISKSAQFPFYTWLPDAMEGPTPVSALLHSATMVAAGAYLMALVSVLIYAAGLSSVLVAVAIVTSFIGALLAIKATDSKRILAYSTIESLSFMFLGIGLLNAGGAIFYLITHAVFKSLLFLIVGTIIVLIGTKDIYKLREHKLSNTWLYFPMLIGLLSLSGIPPLMGFFTHLSLAYTFSPVYDIFFAVVSFLTAIFVFRMFFMIFNSNGKRLVKPPFSYIPITILSAFSLFGGILLFFLGNYISLPYSVTASTFIDILIVGLGAYVSYMFYVKQEHLDIRNRFLSMDKRIFKFSYNDVLNAGANAVIELGNIVNIFESKLSGFYSGLSDASFKLSSFSRRIQNGDVETYISAILIGALAIIITGSFFL